MREIKFRAKRIEDGKWVYADWLFGFSLYPSVDLSTIGQYTGLKDKNGVEIFEGDIVKIEYGGGVFSTHKIFFDPDRAQFWDNRLEDGDSLSCYEGHCIEWVRDSTVIGNIHEAPKQ